MSERFAKYEADAQATIDNNAESDRRREAFLARTEAANDTAQLELYGSQGRTFTDLEGGTVIADKDNPITGKLDMIRSNRRFGRTEDERNEAADMYEAAILRDVEEDGLPLAQAKLIADLELADVEKRGKMIGKHVSEGKSVQEAEETVDRLMTRMADRRRAMIIDGGALTMDDYTALREGKDLYPAEEASPEGDSSDDAESNESSTEANAQSDAEREAAERAADLRVLKRLAGENVTDEELEAALDSLSGRKRTAAAAAAAGAASADKENEALQRIADGEPMEDVTRDVNEVPEVDMGDDLDDIDVDGDNEAPVDTRSRRQRWGDELREARRNWKNPVAYLSARMNTAQSARQERGGVNRRGLVAGVIGAAAVIGGTWLALRYGGEGPKNVPNAAVDAINDNLNGSYGPQGNKLSPNADLVEFLSRPFEVKDGDGYTQVMQAAAEANGIDLAPERLEEIHDTLVEEFGEDYIDINGPGNDIYMDGDDERLMEPGKGRWSSRAVVERMAELIKQ